jgi:hypothetical protein
LAERRSFSTCRLRLFNASFQEKESRTEKEGKRREENRKKQGKEAKTSVAIVFFLARTSNHRPGAATAVAISFACFSSK